MKITETTIPPVKPERKFSIELNENEMKLLGVVLGRIAPNEIEKLIKNPDWRIDNAFSGVIYDSGFIYPLYSKLVSIFQS